MVFIKITWQLLSIFSSIQKNSIILRGGETFWDNWPPGGSKMAIMG